MRSPALVALSCAVLSIALVCSGSAMHASAQNATVPLAGLEGTWVLTSSRRPIDQAIDRVVQRLDFITREVAREIMRGRIQPEPRVGFERQGSDFLTMLAGTYGAVRASFDGRVVNGRGLDGRSFTVSQRMVGANLSQRFISEEGTRENIYTLESGGRALRMRVEITSNQLPIAIRYQLRYRRQR